MEELNLQNLDEIMEVESKAFIPLIRTTRENIENRLKKGHVYFGVMHNAKLVGTLAFRYAKFKPAFSDFCHRYPTFNEYAEMPNEENANAIFVYSLGIVPRHRNAINAKRLIQSVINSGKQRDIDFLVADARVPSYNGSNQNLIYEQFDKNKILHNAINKYFRTKILPQRTFIEQDPVSGFYLKLFPEGKVLGITGKNFWKGDRPCGGHMVIMYMGLR